MSTPNIITQDPLTIKWLMLLMIEDLSSVGWCDLDTERERDIAISYFWRGVEQAEIWQREGII